MVSPWFALNQHQTWLPHFLTFSVENDGAIASDDNPRLTETERSLVEFYTKELAQLVASTAVS
jgi:hypothetical protein